MSSEPQKSSAADFVRFQQSPTAQAAWKSARQQMQDRSHGSALSAYRALVQEFPGVPQLWLELAGAATANLDFPVASDATERAAALAPADAPLFIAIGKQFCQLQRVPDATACFERAVNADPNSPASRLTLVSWLERNAQLDEAWLVLEACLAKNPGHPRALYLRAFLLHRRGRNDEAEHALRALLKNEAAIPLDGRANIYQLLGVVQDALGRYDEALRSLETAKAFQRQTVNAAALEAVYDQLDQARRSLLAQLTSDTVRRWREESEPLPHPLALLGGAPRSGTTLIEQILGAHPKIHVFDEPASFAKELMDTFYAGGAISPELRTLDTLPVATRSQSAARYFKSLLWQAADIPAGQILLDKNPSTTGSLHLWLRLFANSKILIALRDPRDVLVSCYFQNIPANATSINFLTLERTARFYTDLMDVWLRLRDLGGFDWLETRYEDVVNNLESEGRRITGFLGLEWDSGQSAYYEKARGKFLNAPTYSDVTKPVYKKAIKRWEKYAGALAPVQSRLSRYCQIFGYE